MSVVGGETGLIDAAWIGGSFEGIKNGSNQDPIGNVFELDGKRVRLEGIAVKNFKSGWAFSLKGDDILLKDAQVLNPGRQDTGGIQFTRGDNFRCENPTVDVGGDALLLAPETSSDSITNTACLGLSASSVTGSVLAIETAGGTVDTVRVDGLKATGGSAGNVVRIRNSGTSPLTNVALRNAVVTCGTSTADGVSILVTSTGALTAVLLDGLTVLVPSGTAPAAAVRINSTSNVFPDGVRWSGGGVRPLGGATATFTGQSLVTRKCNNVQLLGLTLDGSTNALPVVIGDNGPCNAVVLADVAVTRVAAQTGTSPPTPVGVTFDIASNCGFIRGSIAGVSSARAVRFAGRSDGCFVEDADLTKIGNSSNPPTTGDLAAKIDVATIKPYRLTNNAGSSQRSQMTMGPMVMVDLTTDTITPTSSSVMLNPKGSTTLKKIRTITDLNAMGVPLGQSQPGDLLVLSVAGTNPVTIVNGGTGNIRLQGTANISLGSEGADTLTLLCRGTDWVQLAYSDNG